MPTINMLDSVTSVTGSDQVPIYSGSNGDTRKASIAVIAEYIVPLIETADSSGLAFMTQYAAPSATGFNIAVAPTEDGQNVYLQIIPNGAYAAGTVTLPSAFDCVDGQEVLVTCTQAVTTLTIAGNSAIAIYGAPATLAANAFFKLRYDEVSTSWFRVG